MHFSIREGCLQSSNEVKTLTWAVTHLPWSETVQLLACFRRRRRKDEGNSTPDLWEITGGRCGGFPKMGDIQNGWCTMEIPF